MFMSFVLLYIDPGAGSLLYQAILSGFLTGAVFFKSIKLYFSKWVRILKKDNTKQAEENSN